MYNIFLRRDQIRAVQLHVNHQHFRENVEAIRSINAQDLLVAGFAAPEADAIRAVLRSNKVEARVKIVLKSMQAITASVEGTDAWRASFFFKFGAMRIWAGCHAIFFTLNPNDAGSAFTIMYSKEHQDADRKSVV